MSKNEFLSIIESSLDKGIWIFTQDYIYGMVPSDPDGNRWIEVSYTFDDDDPLVKNERNADLSYQFLFEELEKGLPYYIEDFHVNNLKEFAKTIESKLAPERINSLISELINNSNKYTINLPLIKNKDELEKLKNKL